MQEVTVTYTDVIKFYFQQARVTTWKTPVIFILRIIVVLTVVAEPWIIKNLIDELQIGTGGEVWRYVWMLAITASIEFVTRRLIELWIVPAQLTPMRQIAIDAFDYLHRHGSTFFADNMSGSLLKKVKDGMFAFESIYDDIVFHLITPVGLTIGALIVLSRENLQLGLILGGRVIAFVWFQMVMYRKKGIKEEVSTKSRSLWSGYLADTFSNHATVEHTGGLSYEESLHLHRIDDRYDKSLKNRYFGNIIYGISGLLQQLFFVGGLAFAIYLRQGSVIELGVIVMFLFYAQTLLTQLRGIGNVFKSMIKSLEDAKEFLMLLRTPHQVVDTQDAKDIVIKTPSISFDGVHFGYTDDKETEIQDFNLHIDPYEHIGLVGTSGAGKSTLIKLLLRLYDIRTGKIGIGSHTITQFTLESLRSQISYVPQDPLLFHRTLRENIMYGQPEATEQEMIDAAIRARAHNFIMQLPQGYDSLVGERGVKLSGGQRQRVAIARAILQDSPIIILDEATSSLDSVTETQIQEAIQEVMKEKTAIIIAHRLGTVKNLDRLLVLEAGKIVEQGTHTELLENNGVYAQLWKHQV